MANSAVRAWIQFGLRNKDENCLNQIFHPSTQGKISFPGYGGILILAHGSFCNKDSPFIVVNYHIILLKKSCIVSWSLQ